MCQLLAPEECIAFGQGFSVLLKKKTINIFGSKLLTSPFKLSFSANVLHITNLYKSGCIRRPKSQFETKTNLKHQFVLINHNIFLITNRLTCFMSEPLRNLFVKDPFVFLCVLGVFFIIRDLFFNECKKKIRHFAKKKLSWFEGVCGGTFERSSMFFCKKLYYFCSIFMINVFSIVFKKITKMH